MQLTTKRQSPEEKVKQLEELKAALKEEYGKTFYAAIFNQTYSPVLAVTYRVNNQGQEMAGDIDLHIWAKPDGFKIDCGIGCEHYARNAEETKDFINLLLLGQ